MLKSIIINFAGIFNSRILGFIRDLLSANILGANIYSDMFFVAFKFPNLFRRIFAEGTFEKSFLPAYKKAKYKPSFAFRVFVYLLSIIVVLSIFVNIFSYEVTSLLAYGFSEEEKQFTAKLLSINFWYLDAIFIVTFFASLLKYKNHFFVPAFSTALLNISMIIALILSQNLPKDKIVINLSFAVVIGGIAQVIAHLIVAKKLHILRILYIGSITKHKASLELFKKNFLHSMWGNSTMQISAFIDTWLASFLAAGSISYLYYANRLFQLPFALFVISFSNVFFPKIVKSNKDNFEKIKLSFWYLLYILLFATIITFFSSKEIVRVLFQRGAFTPQDTIITSQVLLMYIIGLIPYGVAKVFTDYLNAQNKQKIVSKISTISLIVNVLFSLILIFPLKVLGLALASSLGGVALFIMSIKEFGFKEFIRFFERKYIIYLIGVVIVSIMVGILFNYLLSFVEF
jgi:putative peptidoglycan lipid II flippase